METDGLEKLRWQKTYYPVGMTTDIKQFTRWIQSWEHNFPQNRSVTTSAESRRSRGRWHADAYIGVMFQEVNLLPESQSPGWCSERALMSLSGEPGCGQAFMASTSQNRQEAQLRLRFEFILNIPIKSCMATYLSTSFHLVLK